MRKSHAAKYPGPAHGPWRVARRRAPNPKNAPPGGYLTISGHHSSRMILPPSGIIPIHTIPRPIGYPPFSDWYPIRRILRPAGNLPTHRILRLVGIPPLSLSIRNIGYSGHIRTHKKIIVGNKASIEPGCRGKYHVVPLAVRIRERDIYGSCKRAG